MSKAMDRYERLKKDKICVQCAVHPAIGGNMCVNCRNVTRVNSSKYRKESPERHRKYKRDFIKNQKIRAYDILGNKCTCCGETNVLFLTIDHVNNDGYKDKKRKRNLTYLMYREVIENIYPGKYQILCWNCNCAKRINYGICPHKQILKELIICKR